jgi:two-component system KDP operon response regulator KdpE
MLRAAILGCIGTQSHANDPIAPLRVADLQIDALRRAVQQGGRSVRLTPDEHILLYWLVAKAGTIVTYRDLAAALGLTALPARNNTLARHLSGLRQKLRDNPNRPHYIETITGVGYRLVVED